jgi:hypothetical protein
MVAPQYAAGGDDILIASQLTTRHVATEAEYRECGRPDAAVVIPVSRLGSEESIASFHIHGVERMLRLASEYDANILNRHDRLTRTSLREGHTIVGKGVAVAVRSGQA